MIWQLKTIGRIRHSFLLLVLFLSVTSPVEMFAQGSTSAGNAPAANAAQGSSESARQASNQNGGGGRISEEELAGLPLNGRSYSQLATLQGGVSETGDSGGSGAASRGVGGGGLSVSGGRSASNTFLSDGTMIMNSNNEAPRSAAGVQLGSDAVMQVQVFSNTYSAEYGRSSGGVLNSISKSGTPQFRGTLFEYFRNSKMDARKFTDGSEPPPFKRNQFGFTLTGPVVKDRTFFMGSFEAMRDRYAETVINTFPDPFARLGRITPDCSGIIRPNDSGSRIVQVHEIVKPYLTLYPVPTGDCKGGGVQENAGVRYLPTDEEFFVVRMDHQLTQRDSFFVRYTFDDATSDTSLESYLFNRRNLSRQQYLTLVATHIFSPSLLNTVRLGYTRPKNSSVSIATVSEVPINLYFVPNGLVFGQIDVPGITTFGPANNAPESFTMNSFQYSDDLVMRRGAHGLRMGGEVHRYRWDNFGTLEKGGIWSFNSLDSFLQGGPEGTNLRVALPESSNDKALRQTLFGFYLQDEYRMSSRLQLSLGLRYEFATMIKDNYNSTAFLPDTIRGRESDVQLGPYVRDNPSLLNFSPRFGITWSPGGNQNLVVRAGFGIFYDELMQYVVQQRRSSLPFYKIAARTNFNATSTFPLALNAIAAAPSQSRFTLRVLDYQNISSPQVYRYNVGVQQTLPGGWRSQVNFVGARGNNLYRSYETNLFPNPIVRSDGSLCFPPDITTVDPARIDPSCPAVSPLRAGPVNPEFSGIQMLSSDAQSFYNSLQLSAGKSAGRNFSVSATYTFSKSVDESSSHQGGNFQYALLRKLERGLSDFDIRNRLTINYFYTLPFGSGQKWLTSGWLGHMVGGWRLGGIASFRNGTPYAPQINVRTRGYLFAASRPNLLPGQSTDPSEGSSAGCGGGIIPAGTPLGTSERYFDPCAFSVPALGTLGNLGRNTMIAPSVFTMDMSLQRDYSIDGKRSLQFRAEFFNLPNHTNYGRPETLVFSGQTGRLNETAGNIRSVSSGARQIQLALRLSF